MKADEAAKLSKYARTKADVVNDSEALKLYQLIGAPLIEAAHLLISVATTLGHNYAEIPIHLGNNVGYSVGVSFRKMIQDELISMGYKAENIGHIHVSWDTPS